jgi:hypothetical protein
MDKRAYERHTLTLRRLGSWLIVAAAVLLGSLYLTLTITSELFPIRVLPIIREHFVTVIGLPSAALVALCVVILLESSSGPLEFEGLGFKFKGAAGPVVLWIACFLAIVISIKLLW